MLNPKQSKNKNRSSSVETGQAEIKPFLGTAADPNNTRSTNIDNASTWEHVIWAFVLSVGSGAFIYLMYCLVNYRPVALMPTLLNKNTLEELNSSIKLCQSPIEEEGSNITTLIKNAYNIISLNNDSHTSTKTFTHSLPNDLNKKDLIDILLRYLENANKAEGEQNTVNTMIAAGLLFLCFSGSVSKNFINCFKRQVDNKEVDLEATNPITSLQDLELQPRTSSRATRPSSLRH